MATACNKPGPAAIFSIVPNIGTIPHPEPELIRGTAPLSRLRTQSPPTAAQALSRIPIPQSPIPAS
ncbi:hypothetical protein [Lysobacter gummosus]|uniref:hypothetical protein n=1 Tax=Lysobacter gummosus TaxID=262324 RepID=UPI0036378E78